MYIVFLEKNEIYKDGTNVKQHGAVGAGYDWDKMDELAKWHMQRYYEDYADCNPGKEIPNIIVHQCLANMGYLRYTFNAPGISSAAYIVDTDMLSIHPLWVTDVNPSSMIGRIKRIFL